MGHGKDQMTSKMIRIQDLNTDKGTMGTNQMEETIKAVIIFLIRHRTEDISAPVLQKRKLDLMDTLGEAEGNRKESLFICLDSLERQVRFSQSGTIPFGGTETTQVNQILTKQKMFPLPNLPFLKFPESLFLWSRASSFILKEYSYSIPNKHT